jgi:hypothetical protein
MSFHVGQQVVCVDDRFSDHEIWRRAVRSFPKLRGVYTIREIIEDDGLFAFCFFEITNPPAPFFNGCLEPAFNSENFRPVRKTSIEVLERLLVPVDRVEVAREKGIGAAAQ